MTRSEEGAPSSPLTCFSLVSFLMGILKDPIVTLISGYKRGERGIDSALEFAGRNDSRGRKEGQMLPSAHPATASTAPRRVQLSGGRSKSRRRLLINDARYYVILLPGEPDKSPLFGFT